MNMKIMAPHFSLHVACIYDSACECTKQRKGELNSWNNNTVFWSREYRCVFKNVLFWSISRYKWQFDSIL